VNISSFAAVCAGLSLGILAACSDRPASATVQTPPPGATAGLAASHAQAAASPDQSVTGTVLETMDASNYTYMRIKTGSGELWAAASQLAVAVGDTVTVSLDQPMEHFHSKALNRDFDVIYFVSRVGRPGDPAAALPAGHPSVPSTAAAAAAVTAPIERAPNGSTVAEVWQTRKTLAGKTVTVRGKVVKYNGGILGVNWIHLQDGSGAAADGSNDITVTTDAPATLGDIITATGTVALDKDLGAGYFYPVIIEHATIVRR
jgi:hypothetical protein